MTETRWERVKQIFARALELTESSRNALLAQECAGEPDLLREVQELLLHAEGPTLLSDPPRLLDEGPLAPGEKLGPYLLIAPLGKGGMGEVYRAMDPRMGREVAIKRVPEHFSGRFEREVRAIAALNHPNICTIHDVGSNYLVMEYLEGASLKGPIPEGKAIELARQIASGLEAAHAKGIIHRDLKPANILRTSEGVKLLDFGIATLADPMFQPAAVDSRTASVPANSTHDPALTHTMGTRVGETVGTPAYMSPEQSAGQLVDARSDIFAFGAVLYEMLTGHRAFGRETARETMLAVQREEPGPLGASPEVAQIVARCLRKQASERYQTATELREAVEKAVEALSRKAPCVAVLPFVMAGNDPENEYFSDGLTEDIINALSLVGGLKVIARTSTFAFKHKAQDIRSIADTLGANHVLEGSVRMAGSRIRITTQLIEAQDGTQLWSKRYDGDLHDVFAIQDEISHAIATELRVSLAARTLVRPPTEHFEAYQEVLRGRHHMLRFHPVEQAKALACFEKAAAIDPEYAAAHAGIAIYHWGQIIVGTADTRASLKACAAAAREALRLDPLSSEAHHCLGCCLALADYDWVEAERYFRRALELNLNSQDAAHCYTHYCLGPLGRMEEALRVQELALQQDPLSPYLNFIHAVILESLGRHEAEAEAVERINRLDSRFVAGQLLLVRLRARERRFAEALEIAETVVRDHGRWAMTLACLAIAHAAAGNREMANAVIAEMGSAPGAESRAFYASLIAAALGDKGEAFRWAAESIQHHDQAMAIFLRTSSFKFMRSDPRYTELLRMLKLTA